MSYCSKNSQPSKNVDVIATYMGGHTGFKNVKLHLNIWCSTRLRPQSQIFRFLHTYVWCSHQEKRHSFL